MEGRNWLAANDGQCCLHEINILSEKWSQPYRLYRFLTDIEDLITAINSDRSRLEAIYPLVRKLLASSEWLQYTPIYPDAETGWDVLTLYDEPSFPLTVQLVTWKPGAISPIHNHGCWGIVAMLTGSEKNTLWRLKRGLVSDIASQPEFKPEIEAAGDIILTPGDILGLMPDAIHHIEAIGDEPTVSFNLYGETDYERRFEFDSAQKLAMKF